MIVRTCRSCSRALSAYLPPGKRPIKASVRRPFSAPYKKKYYKEFNWELVCKNYRLIAAIAMTATGMPSVILSLSSIRKGYRDYFESESIVSKSNRTWGDEDRRLRVALAGKDYFSCSSEDCRR